MSEEIIMSQSNDAESVVTNQPTIFGIDLTRINKPNYDDPQVLNHKESFEKWLNSSYEKTNTSFVLKYTDVVYIKEVLVGAKVIQDVNRRYTFKQKNYCLFEGRLARTIDKLTKPVAYLEQFYELIYEIHSIKRGHQGIQKTFDQICLRYYGITRETVDQFRKTCYICNLNTKKTSQDRLKPIVSTSIFERVQIDLVDMRNCPDGEYNWIVHMEDHNGQSHCLWPQKKRRQIFYVFLCY